VSERINRRKILRWLLDFIGLLIIIQLLGLGGVLKLLWSSWYVSFLASASLPPTHTPQLPLPTSGDMTPKHHHIDHLTFQHHAPQLYLHPTLLPLHTLTSRTTDSPTSSFSRSPTPFTSCTSSYPHLNPTNNQSRRVPRPQRD
jgi:hypothetical protein